MGVPYPGALLLRPGEAGRSGLQWLAAPFWLTSEGDWSLCSLDLTRATPLERVGKGNQAPEAIAPWQPRWSPEPRGGGLGLILEQLQTQCLGWAHTRAASPSHHTLLLVCEFAWVCLTLEQGFAPLLAVQTDQL